MVEFEDFEHFCMGTNIIQRIYSTNAKKIAILVESELKRLENLMSFYINSSDVGRLNLEAGQTEVPLSKETFEVIQKAKVYSKLCNGAFDITIAPLVKLWGIFSTNQRVPSENEIENILSLINYKDIILNIEERSAKLLKIGQKIDLGAIAKGYAADRIIDIYKKNDVQSGFINLGGNVLTLGNKPDGSPWLIGKSSIEADALSTAIFILGLRKGMELVNKLDDTEAIFITSEKKVFVTKGAKEKFSFIDTSNEFEYMEDIFL